MCLGSVVNVAERAERPGRASAATAFATGSLSASCPTLLARRLPTICLSGARLGCGNQLALRRDNGVEGSDMIRMSLFQRGGRHRKGRAATLLTIMSTTMLDIGPWLARHDGRHGDRN